MNLDEQTDKDLLKKLENLGLTDKEGRVYLALLPRRNTGTSKLIRATGLHGQFVYDSLNKLEELGLAQHVVESGRKKFSASTPNRLLSLIEEKRFTAQSIAKELQNRFAGALEQNFEVFQGDAAFVAHQYDLLERTEPGTQVDAICGPSERFLAIFGAEADHYELKRIEKGVTVRYLGAEVQRNLLSVMEKWRKLWTFRLLPGHATGLVDTDIWA
ncbi:MAG: helix-turn-helix domain-containing protein, partial [bacterium]|nr:helix-turn-helix domain-containing protein [bacterium]